MASSKGKLTRAESKRLTRMRLIQAAMDLVMEVGYSALSASRIAKRAGIAQPSFYVHFKNKDELARVVARELSAELREELRERRRLMKDGMSVERVRESFRLPMSNAVKNPFRYRLATRERHVPGSKLGAILQELHEEILGDLIQDLTMLGMPSETTADKTQLLMVAEGMMSLLETVTLGHLDGRFPDMEACIDLMVNYTRAAVVGIDIP